MLLTHMIVFPPTADVQSSVNTSKAMQEEMHMSHAGSPLGEELTSESVTTSVAMQSSSTIPPSSKGSEEPPFGCGCGKCTFFTYVVSCNFCPKPISSASSFRYLDLGRLTPEEQLDLRGKLHKEFMNITNHFQCLVSTTLKSLQKQCVRVRDLLPHLMTLGTYEPVFKDSQEPVLRQQFKTLEKAESISDIFWILKDYMSFFNYHIIKHIIKTLGTEEDKERLREYKKKFHQYAKRRVYECLPQYGPESKAGHADIFVKVDSQYENYTVAEIEDFRHKLSKILHVSSQGVLRLCRVEKGCFQLLFQVPSFVQQTIFPLSKEQERGLTAEGVIRLTCGEYKFQVSIVLLMPEVCPSMDCYCR